MKTAFITEQLIGHPCSSRAAHDKLKVIPTVAPTVPEKLQSTYKTGARSIEPRQLIYEHNDFIFLQRRQILFKLPECLTPRFGRGLFSTGIFLQLLLEVIKMH